MVSPIAKVTSVKSSVGIFTHQGHISQVGSTVSVSDSVTHVGSIASHDAKNQTKYRETLSLIGHFLPFPRIFDPRKPDIGKLLSCLPDAVDDSLPTYHLSTAPVYQCTSAVYLCALKRNNLLVSYTTPRCAWPSVNFSLHFMSDGNVHLSNALIRSAAGTRHILKGISL